MAGTTVVKVYHVDYSDASFWRKLIRFCHRMSEEMLEKALLLYIVLQDKSSPPWARRVVIGALAYLISPLDVVPDFVPVGGFVDDAVVIAAALTQLSVCITEDMRDKARRWAKSLLGTR